MTPKDIKDIKRSIFINALIITSVHVSVGILMWEQYQGRKAELQRPVCLAPEHSFTGMDVAVRPWTVTARGGEVYLCGPDSDRKGVHCTRMTERSSIECAKWAGDWEKRNAKRVESIP